MHDAFGTQEVSTCVRVRVRLQSPRVSPEECQCLHKEVQLLMLSELQRGEQQRREEQRMEALLAHTHTQLELLRGLNYTLPLFFFPFVLSSFFKQKLSTWLESQTVSRHFGRFQADCFYCVLSCRSTFFPILWVLYINIMTINSVFYEVYIITFTGCKCKATQCKCFLLNSWRLERAAIDWWREHIYLNLPNQTNYSHSPHRCPASSSCHSNMCRVLPEPLRSHRRSCPRRPQCNAAGRSTAVVEDPGRDGWRSYPWPTTGVRGGAWRTVCRGDSRCQQSHRGGWNKPLTWKQTDWASVDLILDYFSYQF